MALILVDEDCVAEAPDGVIPCGLVSCSALLCLMDDRRLIGFHFTRKQSANHHTQRGMEEAWRRLFEADRVARAWLIFPDLDYGSGGEPEFGVMGIVKLFRTVLRERRTPIRLACYKFLEGSGPVDVRLMPPARGGGDDSWVTWRRRAGGRFEISEVPRAERAGVTVFPLVPTGIPAMRPINWKPSADERVPVLQTRHWEEGFEQIPQWLVF